MSRTASRTRNDRALNLFVSYEIKKSLEELAERHDRTLADVVRTSLKVALPILQGIWEAEERLIDESSSILGRTGVQVSGDN